MALLTTDFSNSRAVIIDSSPMTRSILTSQFREFGFEKVTQCTRLSEAREHFNESAFDVVLCEHNFGHETPTGIDLVDELRSKQMLPMSTVVFMLTGEASYARVAEAAETGLDGYLLKPHKANQLHERLRLACYRKDSFREVFAAMEQKAFDVAADLCLERYQHRGLFWLYAARVGAELLMRTSRFQEAQELYEAIAEAKTAPWAKLGVARAMMESGNTVGAANALGVLIEDDPSFADAYDVLARAQFELGNVAQARATYKMACEMTPDSVPRLQSLAMMSFYAGDTKEAGQLLDRATRIGLDSKLFDCQTLVVLAFTQLDANDHRGLQRSRDNFTRLLERNPGSARHQRGVLPSMSFAAKPTASPLFRTMLVPLRTATTEGSFNTMPSPRTHTKVLQVPRSIPISTLKRRESQSISRAKVMLLPEAMHPSRTPPQREPLSGPTRTG